MLNLYLWYWCSGVGPGCEVNTERCRLFITLRIVQQRQVSLLQRLQRGSPTSLRRVKFFLLLAPHKVDFLSGWEGQREFHVLVAFMLTLGSSYLNETHRIDSQVGYKIIWNKIFVAWKRCSACYLRNFDLKIMWRCSQGYCYNLLLLHIYHNSSS